MIPGEDGDRFITLTEIKDEEDLMCGDDKWWGEDGGNLIMAAAAALEFI